MTDMKSKPTEAADELMTADEAEVRAILEARYPNDRRLQRAMIRLAELRPEGRYGSMLDVADPSFQRIVALPVSGESGEGTEEAGSAQHAPAPGPQPVALKVEPLVTTTSATAGRPGKPAGGAVKSAGKPAK